jgi:hypothetical protein
MKNGAGDLLASDPFSNYTTKNMTIPSTNDSIIHHEVKAFKTATVVAERGVVIALFSPIIHWCYPFLE